jgi:hypothetical protein
VKLLRVLACSRIASPKSECFEWSFESDLVGERARQPHLAIDFRMIKHFTCNVRPLSCAYSYFVSFYLMEGLISPLLNSPHSVSVF